MTGEDSKESRMEYDPEEHCNSPFLAPFDFLFALLKSWKHRYDSRH